MKVSIDTSPLHSGHSVRGIGYYTKYLLAALQEHYPEILASGKQTDILHYPFFDIFFLTLPILKTKPTIVTIHDVIPLVYPNEFPAGIRGNIKRMVQQFSLLGVKAVLTDSEHSKRDIATYLHINPEKIYVAYLAVSDMLKPLPKNSLGKIREQYNLPETFFLHVGDINYNKNVMGLLEAFAHMHDTTASLVFVGKVFEHVHQREVIEVKNSIEKHELQNRVKLIGFVPDEDMTALYNLAVACVHPSFYEGFGMPPLEAMQCGTPVISSDRSSLKEVIGDATYIVNPDDIESIAAGLEAVLHSTDLQNELSQKGIEQASKFTGKRFADETVAVYQRVFDQYCR